MVKNYYEILGVSIEASQDEIKHAYRILVKKYHPDINHEPNAEAIMQSINEAYEVLSNISLRKQYDARIKIQKSSASSHAYSSYNKTREESEKDLEEWIKEYLKKIRINLNEKDALKLEKEFLITLKQNLINKKISTYEYYHNNCINILKKKKVYK